MPAATPGPIRMSTPLFVVQWAGAPTRSRLASHRFSAASATLGLLVLDIKPPWFRFLFWRPRYPEIRSGRARRSTDIWSLGGIATLPPDRAGFASPLRPGRDGYRICG